QHRVDGGAGDGIVQGGRGGQTVGLAAWRCKMGNALNAGRTKRNARKNMRMPELFLHVILLLCSAGAAYAGETVAQWRMTEIVLTGAKEYAKPFNDVDVTATFTG